MSVSIVELLTTKRWHILLISRPLLSVSGCSRLSHTLLHVIIVVAYDQEVVDLTLVGSNNLYFKS